jgi:hypothetical protein
MYYNAETGVEISDDDMAAMHDDLIDELYPLVTIGIYQWSPASVLKRMDPVAYHISVIEYADQLHQDGQITETPCHTTADGSVCVDCLMAIANGDTSGISDVDKWAAAVESTNATENGRYRVVVSGDGESYFSSSRCDYCSDPLAGDRIDVEFVAECVFADGN